MPPHFIPSHFLTDVYSDISQLPSSEKKKHISFSHNSETISSIILRKPKYFGYNSLNISAVSLISIKLQQFKHLRCLFDFNQTTAI